MQEFTWLHRFSFIIFVKMKGDKSRRQNFQLTGLSKFRQMSSKVDIINLLSNFIREVDL